MSFDLLETAKSIFNSDFISQASSQLGESEGGIQKAISGIVPTVLTGLLNKAGSSGEAGGLLNLVKGVADHANTSAVSNALQSGSGGLISKGTELLQSLFGDKVSSITGMLSSFAGIKETSANTLLQSATPATLGAVGQYAVQNNLTPSTFLSFLNTQKDKILGAVPGGLNLAGILGLSSLGDLGKKMSNLVHMNVRARVAETLLALLSQFGKSRDGSIDIQLSRQDIAAFTGTTYETLFRTMQEFIQGKLIRVSGKKIFLLKEKKLAELTLIP